MDGARNDDQHHPDQRRQPGSGTPGDPDASGEGATGNGGEGGEPDRPRLDLQA